MPLVSPRRLLVVFLITAILGIAFGRPLLGYSKAMLLLSEEFPQVPVKPLRALTSPPEHRTLSLPSEAGTIRGDLFLPAEGPLPWPGNGSHPALIVAMGVKTAEDNRALILGFAETLGRLGFVVLWPRLAAIDQGRSLPEAPETLVAGFRYLQGLKQVKPDRIGFFGISVGSSIAFVAATDPRIADQVHGLVFFGGYYDALGYLKSLATGQAKSDDSLVPWEPGEGAVKHLRDILDELEAREALEIFQAGSYGEAEQLLGTIPPEQIEPLRSRSPSEHLAGFQARIFILHERSDHFVPYTESLLLRDALGPERVTAFELVNLLEHVQPRGPLTRDVIGEFLKLYGFTAETLTALE